MVTGAGAPEIAHSGSFRPLPVTVHTTREPAGSSPACATCSNPATEAADAGSTNTASRTPRMWGFQAAGAAPIVTGKVVEQPSTIATAIRIGNPASWTKAVAARDESGGRIDAVTDRAILAAYRLLARSEAVFVEPASAASVAGLLQVAQAGELPAGSRVVCTVTGNGLKDPEWAISGAPAPVTIPVDAAAAATQLGL